jgi:hypothetical protein
MKSALRDVYTTLRTEGALLPPDLLQRVAEGDKNLAGLTPSDYHCEGEKLNEVASRAWQRLQGRWAAFEAQRDALSPDDTGTTITRERWLLPLFQELGYGRLQATSAIVIGGKDYPVSHVWASVPIHLVGCKVELDTRTAGVAGAARRSPHSLVQELLNRSDDHLWAFASNGLQLRILHDNVSLSRQAYVEFDLEAMMRGELYADFVLLWLLCHESRIEGDKPEECWLERWSQEAQLQGLRALEGLRSGVTKAITTLGKGFLANGANRVLLEKLRSGALDNTEYYRQLLRLVYRLLFLFTAEDRDLLLLPLPEGNGDEVERALAARERYARFYSGVRLRDLAANRRGSRHSDLYEGLELVMRWLESDEGCPALALPALGSFLFSEQAMSDLVGCRLANSDLLEAVRALAFTVDAGAMRPIDFRNLGAEELGSVYESLLEMQPELNRDAATFDLKVVSGSERKTTGSYYTPSSLIQCLLDSALDPVIEDRLASAARGVSGWEERRDAAEAVLLNLKICDPACGSGHFLIAATHRMARRLAMVRTGGDEPAPWATRQALRDVIGRCIYGVDINPMAVELCKVNLWMEALEPGKPLAFLDHRIQCGNSLLGATPALLRGGIPDDAFTAIEGDERRACAELRKQNKRERAGQTSLFVRGAEASDYLNALAKDMTAIDGADDATLEGIREKQERYKRFVHSSEYVRANFVADTWCASFVWPKRAESVFSLTQDVFRRIEEDREREDWPLEDVKQLADRYRFFHWHLQFPDVFRVSTGDYGTENEQAGWSGGFDVVLGNPPWERVKLQEKEWFAAHGRSDIAEAPNAAKRKALIGALSESEDPVERRLYAAFKAALRQANGESQLLRASGRYPLCGRGDVNTYAVFAELQRSLLSPEGQVGCIVPSGIASDDTTKLFFHDLVDTGSLLSLFSFENEEKLFQGVHNEFKFCLLAMRHRSQAKTAADFVFFQRQVADLADRSRHFALTADDIALLNPNTHTCPIFRSSRDAEIAKGIYRRVPVLAREGPPAENPWAVTFMRMFDMANDSHLFRTFEQLEKDGWALDGDRFRRGGQTSLPLYEGKMIWQYDHHFGTYEGQSQAQANKGFLPQLSDDEHREGRVSLPKYWVPEAAVLDRAHDVSTRGFTVVYRSIARCTDHRTIVAAALPFSACSGKLPLVVSPRSARDHLLLLGNLNSLVADYCVRQKAGGTDLPHFVMKQLPILPPQAYERALAGATAAPRLKDWLLPRLLELVYTNDDLRCVARACGYDGPPYRWDECRRFRLRCEIDAAFFHAYGLARGEVEHVLQTFPIVKRKEQAEFGSYRTGATVLEQFDSIAAQPRTEVVAGDLG